MKISPLFFLITIAVGVPFFASASEANERPNILWLVSEDNSADWLGCYGNETASTPNLDTLAAEGFRYTHCFSDAPVCATQRSTWITGMASIALGTHPMRSGYRIPDTIPVYNRLLQEAGYYTRNGGKTDYNGVKAEQYWDDLEESGTPWENAPEGAPWFCIVNMGHTHESAAFKGLETTKVDPEGMQLAAYHPNLETIRKNYADYTGDVSRMDHRVGRILNNLEEAGFAENTIVVYNSDHGGVMPRSKRFLFDNGIHCPLILRVPEKFKEFRPDVEPGEPVSDIVSYIDMIPTWLNMADVKIPELMQGRIFLGPDKAPLRKYHFAFRERMDERYDNARAVRDERFLYIRNYAPFAPWMQHLTYLWKIPATQAWDAQRQTDEATELNRRWFQPKIHPEELYDTELDPDCINNLADSAGAAAKMEEMRGALRSWQLEIRDTALLPEAERAHRAYKLKTTIYEMAQSDETYNLPAYLDAADLATSGNSNNIPELLEFMDLEDSGLRYWGVVGVLMVDSVRKSEVEPILVDALEDDSDEVRAFAAYALIKHGFVLEQAYGCLMKLLNDKSYASVITLNIIDWMGEQALPLKGDLLAFTEGGKPRNKERKLLECINSKLSNL